MKTLYLGAMKSSGSAEWRDGGAHKALTALRKSAAGSYVILFLTTLTDVCFSNFTAAVNESRAEIYLIQQNLPACNQKLKNKKKHTEKQLARWPQSDSLNCGTLLSICDLLKFRGESLVFVKRTQKSLRANKPDTSEADSALLVIRSSIPLLTCHFSPR